MVNELLHAAGWVLNHAAWPLTFHRAGLVWVPVVAVWWIVEQVVREPWSRWEDRWIAQRMRNPGRKRKIEEARNGVLIYESKAEWKARLSANPPGGSDSPTQGLDPRQRKSEAAGTDAAARGTGRVAPTTRS